MKRTVIALLLVVPPLLVLGCTTSTELTVSSDTFVHTTYPAGTMFFLQPADDLEKYGSLRRPALEAVADELASKGFRVSTDGVAPYFMRIALHLSDEGRSTPSNQGYSNTGGYQPGYSPATPARFGRLTIEVRDPETGKTLWRGSASGFAGNIVDAKKQMRKSVHALLSNFPPL